MSDPGPATTWIDACRAFAARHRVPAEIAEALEAFGDPHPRGGPPPPPLRAWSEGFEALEAACAQAVDVPALTRVLVPEAEGNQPSIFARRASVVDTMLRSIGSAASRVLHVGLRMRLEGILQAPPPRLRRVRALADFYYSHAALLLHPEWRAEPHRLGELVEAAEWRSVAAGLEHGVLDGLAGGMPVHVNVLRVDPRRVRVRVADLTAVTHQGQAFAEAAGDAAAAAVSGGFFLYSEPDIRPPSRRHDAVGLVLTGGVVRNPAVFARAALLAGAGGELGIRRVALAECVPTLLGERLDPAGFVNRAQSERGPDAPSVAIVGHRVLEAGRSLAVPLNGYVAAVGEALAARVTPGATVEYAPPVVHEGLAARDAVAGGPLLLSDGAPVLDMKAEDFWGSAPPITFSQDETGDRNLLARMAAGLDAQGRLLVAAIDGRNVERALGMTLGDVARLMRHLGCHTAMNLDGGSSKRMLVEGRIVDLPNTEIIAGEAQAVRVRPVHTALIFEPHG